jgi:hypothetical protein
MTASPQQRGGMHDGSLMFLTAVSTAERRQLRHQACRLWQTGYAPCPWSRSSKQMVHCGGVS